MHKIVTETVAIVEKIVKNGKVEHMEQKRMEQRKCGTVEWEKKRNKVEFLKKLGAYCTKTRNKNCENVENDEKILEFR